MAKSNRKRNVIQLDDVRNEQNLKTPRVHLVPKNLAQEEYIEYLNNEQKNIVFAVGPAGTGKTYLAVLKAIQGLREGQIKKLILTRPAVSVDEKHGFLPGDLNAKMQPWLLPIIDYLEEYYSMEQINTLIKENVIEIAPLGFMRGRSFKNAFIIADEIQNATPSQVKMLLTRFGEGCKMVITGDLAQHDRGFEQNGLKDFLDRFSGSSSRIETVRFQNCHIERHPVVSEVLGIYGE
jgi:phosphate starvation-inducible PhoH-like protein